MTAHELARLKKMCVWANSYTRAEVLLSNRPHHWRTGKTMGTEWFKVLGEEWSCCDNIGAYRSIFRSILKRASQRQLQAMMNEEEQEKWAQLPDTIKAWRGCESYDHTGLSFSLYERIARQFPFLTRYLAESPSLITATIPKKSAVLKLGRGEHEIITAFASITHREYLEAKAAP
jgi:hypothetical protein